MGQFHTRMRDRLSLQLRGPRSAFQIPLNTGGAFRFTTLEDIVSVRGNGARATSRGPVREVEALIKGGGGKTNTHHSRQAAHAQQLFAMRVVRKAAGASFEPYAGDAIPGSG